MPPMLYVLIFLAVVLGIEGVSMLVQGSRRSRPERIRRRLKSLARAEGAARNGAGESVVRERAGRDLLSRILSALPSGDSLDRLLQQAGGPTTAPKLLLLTGVLGAGGYAAVTMLVGDPVRGGLGLAAGLLPVLTLRRTARRRRKRFEEQLPEGLELLTRALRAGHGIGSGFQLVGQELEDPLGTEFGVVAEELRFGLDLRDALANLMCRTDNPDLPYFATALLIQRQTGGNLAELLDKLSALLRERGEFYGKVRALTAQGRGAAVFLALWMPLITFVVWYVTPDYLTPLFENSWGHAVLASAAALDIGGFLIARRIADVEA